ncbi:ROK family transcriptional regulator [Limosilactobacillus antri]|uniref:ROK family protein n=2 Tax=Limosilactobacillus antri DSM 16041 TaxID=525309 RepID=C8P5V6_9LACO|nr:ROK family transcriptional regulator [Limosilactobacillus antri]EEW54042.1 ROK family protein [Limosilactobacillus antri DSM 16041]
MRTKTMQSIQQSNYSNIYHLLMHNDKLSKQMIADELGLSLPTVTSNLNRLSDQQLIMKNGQLESKIGRRATAYSINHNAFLSIGIEVFQKYATITVINLKHEVLAIHTVNIPFANSDQYAAALADQVRWVLQNNGYNEKAILGAGIGIQGLIDSAGTTVLWGKILDCTGMRAERFSQFLPFPVRFYHDADCVAAAEYAANPHDGIVLSIGEHFGSAMIVAGKILRSTTGRDGTMEHISINPRHGRPCYCGRRGCIETYCSLSSLLQPTETLNSFFANLKQDDPAVKKRFAEYLDYLAESIYNLHMFIDVPIIIGGRLSKFITSPVLEELRKRLRAISVFPENERYVKVGHVADNAVAIGAAIPFIDEKLSSI